MTPVKTDKQEIDLDVCYREFAPRLFAVAYRILQNQTDALDVVQECFLRAFRNRKKFEARARVSTWLYRITVNLCYDLLRKRTREKKIEYLDNYDIKSVPFDGEKNLQQEKLVGQIKQEMKKLTPKQRTVFILRLYEALPYNEIARITRSRVGTVKATYFQSVMKLRRLLRQRGVLKNEMPAG
ncbi:MAG TPA: RNA polymerase sigma factor [bacterium]|nr:RNA polymerase sigma factor [bacterium]HPP11353.1 RNA polymerase sigma factor [bacterium]